MGKKQNTAGWTDIQIEGSDPLIDRGRSESGLK